MVSQRYSSLSRGATFDQIAKSTVDAPSNRWGTVQKSRLGISEQEFLSNIYTQKEHNAFKAMALLDMWQSFERSILSEVGHHSC